MVYACVCVSSFVLLTAISLNIQKHTWPSLVINALIIVCVDSDSGDPVTVLRTFQSQVMYSRPLNLTSTSETLDGETVPIFVDRFRLLSTTIDELLHMYDDGCDFRKPLEVTFYDERTRDLGKKFFGFSFIVSLTNI